MEFDGTIMALDIASSMGLCVGRPGEKPRFEVIRLAKKDDEPLDVFGRAVGWAAERFMVEKPDRLYIEAPTQSLAMGGKTNARTILILYGLYAAIGGIARRKGIMVREGKVQTIRKHFIGHGNMKGPDAKRKVAEVCRMLGWEPPNHDAADSGALWHWACAQLAPKATPLVDPISLSIAAKQREVFRG